MYLYYGALDGSMFPHEIVDIISDSDQDDRDRYSFIADGFHRVREGPMYLRVADAIEFIEKEDQRGVLGEYRNKVADDIRRDLLHVGQVLDRAADHPPHALAEADSGNLSVDCDLPEDLPPDRAEVVVASAVNPDCLLAPGYRGRLGAYGSQRGLAHAAFTEDDSMLTWFFKSVANPGKLLLAAGEKVPTLDRCGWA